MSDAMALPVSPIEPHTTLALLRAAVHQRDVAAIRQLTEHLDRLSANECLRQLGEEWGFPTVEVQGQRMMAMRDLARLVYGYDDPHNLRKILARFGRESFSLEKLSPKYRASTRVQLGLDARATNATLGTWADLLIVGMRGHTEGAKRLQDYLLKAERENRIQWTVARLQRAEIALDHRLLVAFQRMIDMGIIPRELIDLDQELLG